MASRCLLIIALSAVVLPSDAARSVASPVQKVLGMLDDVGAKTKADLAASVEDFKEFSGFCEKTTVEKDYAMKKSQETIGALDAAIYDAEAKIKEYQFSVTELSSEISSAHGELAKSTDMRAKEHESFLAEEKELVEAVETLQAAGNIGAASFAQMTPEMHSRLATVKSALKSVLEAGFVTHAQHDKVASFLAASEDSELTYKTHNDDAMADVIKGLVEMTQGTLTDMRKKEMAAKHDFDSEKLTIESQISSMEEEMKASQQLEQSTTQELAQANKDMAVEKKVLKTDTEYSADLKRDCESKALDFETLYRDSTAELAALAKAKEILSKGVKESLVETKLKLRSSVRAVNDDGKAKALRAIQELGRRLHSTALVSLAYRASADPFSKIRGMVEEMIAKLQQEAAEAATQEQFCKEEQAKSEKSRAKKAQKLETTNARIEKAESAVARLSEEVATLSSEVAELDAALTEASKIRTSERAKFATAEADLSGSVDACNAAAKVLEDYYSSSGALLQRQASAVKTQGGGSIVEVLRFAESDFAMQLSTLRATETAAASKFTELSKESALLKATKLAEVKGKESEVKTVKASLTNYGADEEGISSELAAVEEYIAELKPKCALAPAESYESKKAKRTQEIEGLREALKMLA